MTLLSEIRYKYAALSARIDEGRTLKAKSLSDWSIHASETLRQHDALDRLIDQLPEPELSILDPKLAWRFRSITLSP